MSLEDRIYDFLSRENRIAAARREEECANTNPMSDKPYPDLDISGIPVETVTALVEKQLGVPVGIPSVIHALPAALAKLQRIIFRKNDTNGDLINVKYIARLVSEIIQSDIFTEMCFKRCNEKRRAAEANAPLEQFHCITLPGGMQEGAANYV